MPQIIASTYEVLEQIGAGGAGVVYLGRHLRLGKKIVLKADKRTLTARPETLRREVDALKNLHHTYIPQVYDFVTESDLVYTVMDYIEGESLDKPLKRGERFPQAQVIEWGCQLLEALAYLHSQPPYGILHSDIKPANLMLTPQGDIRLIDFNIALALGEAGTVRVGFSRGYASPEHYGLDFTAGKTLTTVQDDDATELVDSNGRTVPRCRRTATSDTGSGKHTVLLDVRSDIYSAGATLYHLFTGERPAQDAREVVPIQGQNISPAVAAIIQKAMEPDPDKRYQSAQEMLDAFTHLHENDPRTKRRKRRLSIAAAVLALVFLAGGACTFTGLRQMQRAEAEARQLAELAEEEARRAEEAEQIAKDALAAVTRSEDAYRDGDRPEAIRSAKEALEKPTDYAVRAQKALTDALGVYDLADGFRSHLLVDLPSEPLKVTLSPGGTRVAAMTGGQLLVFDTETGEQLAALAADPSALSDVVFADEETLLYAGEGALQAYDLAQNQGLWTGAAATSIALSADGAVAAAVYKTETFATVYEVSSGAVLRTVNFQGQSQHVASNDALADPERNVLALNRDGTLLAASFANGGLWIYDLRGSEGDMQLFDQSDYLYFEGGFSGAYFAFAARGGEQFLWAIVDTAAQMMVAGNAPTMAAHVYTNEDGIYIANGNVLVRMDPAQKAQREMAYTGADITSFCSDGGYTVTATAEGDIAFFDGAANLLGKWTAAEQPDYAVLTGEYAVIASRSVPALRILKLEERDDCQLFTYDPAYSHTEARVGDGTVMLYRSDRFRVYGMDGTILAEETIQIPEGERVYDQQFRRGEEGSRLEVTFSGGLVRTYSATDGSVLSERQGDMPDESLFEEFQAGRFRIERPLHGTPAAYDRDSGELVKELESNDYLTYVTQTGEYYITEYMTAQGERYGLLLNEELETLARLPGLCDILEDGTLVFDDMRGNLRESRIYSIEELMALNEQ